MTTHTEKTEVETELTTNARKRDASFLQKGVFGGIYIPPFKLAKMMKKCEDKTGQEYQRLTWDALRKSLNGIVNKVNASNIREMLPELFSEVRPTESSFFKLCFRTWFVDEDCSADRL